MIWKIHQMDVKITFLNGVDKEEVSIEKPLGFDTHNRQAHVCKLNNTLYGLKHAPRNCFDRMDKFLMRLGFPKSKEDSNLFLNVEGEIPLTLLLYVDELFLTR